jgi:hypothetical protein
MRSRKVLTRVLDEKQVGTHQSAEGEASRYSTEVDEKQVGTHQKDGCEAGRNLPECWM